MVVWAEVLFGAARKIEAARRVRFAKTALAAETSQAPPNEQPNAHVWLICLL